MARERNCRMKVLNRTSAVLRFSVVAKGYSHCLRSAPCICTLQTPAKALQTCSEVPCNRSAPLSLNQNPSNSSRPPSSQAPLGEWRGTLARER
jgi:hypothetical protein